MGARVGNRGKIEREAIGRKNGEGWRKEAWERKWNVYDTRIEGKGSESRNRKRKEKKQREEYGYRESK